ncbi:MAG: hypothetical protein EBQ96_01950 [Proteobacteria bacterium]|nr:hypothetical protein [Pseudomonadota bacterium]
MKFGAALLDLFNRHFWAPRPKVLRRRTFRKIASVPGSAAVESVELRLFENDGMPIVNYMWLNDVPEWQRRHVGTCSIPLEKLAFAIENANRYPEAKFKFWVDGGLIGPETRFWLASHLYATSRHQNIEICDLRSIPEYAADPLFAPQNCLAMTRSRADFGSVYLRADAARVLILNHCHSKHKDQSKYIFYSDLDCPDLAINNAMNVMRRYGVVINDLGTTECVSHGYIGIDCDHPFVDLNIGRLAKYSVDAAKDRFLGDVALDKFLNAMHPNYMQRLPIRISVLPQISFVMPHNNFFRALGVN